MPFLMYLLITFLILFNSYLVVLLLLNQARASQRSAHDWFLEIAFVRNVSMHVCVPAPKATNN